MNDKVRIVKTETLSDNRSVLKKITFDYQTKKGSRQTKTQEIYDRGDAASILLYNKETKTVILTKQFRLASFINGNQEGMMIETCAGLLDDDSPEECARRESEEETGYKLKDVRKVFEAYMSPGAVTEKLHFFVAEYSAEMKVSKGGGLEEEQEEVEVLEMSFEKALQMINSGEIKDAKTIMLLQHLKIQQLL
jgi:GDP-mannose pyrophosphatase NudK